MNNLILFNVNSLIKTPNVSEQTAEQGGVQQGLL